MSFNPLLWLINGIYLKNRWNHPAVNKPGVTSATQEAIQPVRKYSITSAGGEKAAYEHATQKIGSTTIVQGFWEKLSPKTDAAVRKNSTPSADEEETAYGRAAQEIGSTALKQGLWAKFIAETDGDERVAKARYIKARGLQLLAGC